MKTQLRSFSTLAALAVAIAGIVVAYILTPIGGLMVDDECYQALAARSYRLSPMAPLTYYIGHLWMLGAGDSIVSLRYLQLIFQAVAIGIGVVWCYRRTHRADISLALFGVLLVASKLWGMNIYNWDTGAYPFIMLCLVATLAYSRCPDMKRALAVAATWTLTTASRIPLGAALPVLAALVVYRHRAHLRTAWQQLGAGALLSLAIFIALILLIYGNFTALSEAWQPENIINGHSLKHTAYIYSRLRFTLMCVGLEWYISFAVLICALVWWKLPKGSARLLSLLAGTVFLFIVISAVMLNTDFDVLFGTLQPLTLAVVLLPALGALMSRRRYRLEASSGLLLFFIALPAFGSDSFIERFFVIPILPVACGLVYSRYASPVRAIVLFLAIAVSISAARFAYTVRNHGIAVDSTISEQFDGLTVPQGMYDNMRLAVEATHKVNGRYGRPPLMIIPSLFYLGSYGTNIDVTLGLHHFHFFDYEEDLPLHDTNIEAGRPYIVSTVDGGYITTLNDYLHNQGYSTVDSMEHRLIVLTKDR